MSRVCAILIATCTLWIVSAGAAQATCTGLACSCSVSTSAISFGTYNPISPSDVDVASAISVTCSVLIIGGNVSYQIRLGAGASADQLNRTMKSGASSLGYNLYTDIARATVWGDGSGGTGVATMSYPIAIISRTDDFTIYGRLPAGQSVAAGAYSDTIIATVEF